jgi:UDP-N-acetylmuramoyl-L-alanyl-D-glutamate--2,6-diaminopimelate ligase
MNLEQLIQDVPMLAGHGDLQRPVCGLAYHTAQVVEDGLFVAIRGTRSDGHEFVQQAVARGARTILVEKPLAPIPGVTTIRVSNTRVALARLSNRFYGCPSHELTLIGVTGTNGKTTTACLLEAILTACGHHVGFIGTLDMHYPGRVYPAAVTTPESLDLQRILREMLSTGVTHVVMEVSSHGLDMHRVEGSRFAAGVFTNLSRDHLDYHGTMESYFAAKARLFSQILRDQGGPRALAVINGDDPWGQRLCSQLNGPLLRYGLANNLEVRAEAVQYELSGTSARFQTPAGELEVHSRLIGRPNLYNLLAATATAVGLGLPLETVGAGEQSLVRVPGRLESVPNNAGFQVVVDYAHTPDALEKALDALLELHFRRLICVFGCGGDRDRGKRPLMGEAAARRADLLVITSDNPRSEDPEAIIAEIEAGVRLLGLPRLSPPCKPGCNSGRSYVVVVDRAEAIHLAIACAGPGDVVYIAGKGHETYQIIGDRRIDFDDRQVAGRALASRKERQAS